MSLIARSSMRLPPTPTAALAHPGSCGPACGLRVGSPEEREEALAGAPEVPPSQVLRYMGTDIYL